MTARTGTLNLRIEVGRSAEGDRLLRLFTPPDPKPDEFALVDSGALRQHTSWLGTQLRNFRDLFDNSVDVSPGHAAQALDGLVQAGKGYLSMAFTSLDSVHQVSEVFQEACQGWDDEAVEEPPLIQVVCQLNDHIPWEVLPVFNVRHQVRANTKRELAQACRPILGFGASVERRLLHATYDPLPPTGPVQIRVFRDAQYAGVGEELGVFYANAPLVRVVGPYPRSNGVGAATVAQQLRNPTLGLDGVEMEHPDRVVHFSCHCTADSSRSWQDFTFRLSAADQEAEELTVSRLMGDMLTAAHWAHPERDRLMPLVFLNACGTAVSDPQSAASLLTPFDRNGNRGMIGTAANVPDRFAARFSRSFYRSLFRGESVGRALHEARWQMVHDASNPLGLLYAHYGDGGLYITPHLG